jgi:RimJ/RimL family protein N-acetyltransferase
MEIVKFHKDHSKSLFLYWNRLGRNVPFFFRVSTEKWLECLLNDRLEGVEKFRSQEIYMAIEDERVIGFIQYVQPAFSWDQNGKKIKDPQIGIIRHFYFDEGCLDAAHCLYAKSQAFMKQFPTQHAFFHIFGMSCNAHHGKLHQGLVHIERFILEKGYQVEHENLYFTLTFTNSEIYPHNNLRLVPKSANKPGVQEFVIQLQENNIGGIHIRYMTTFTGGKTADVVYLSWIGIDKTFQKQGWGTLALKLLIANFQKYGYHQIHTDTASTNTAAQHFYVSLGFTNRGRTRSYIKNNLEKIGPACSQK